MALTSGYAQAVKPETEEPKRTTTEGLIAGEVAIPTADVPVPGYRAMPDTGANFPIVLVIQEIFGVHEYIQDVCRRFAKRGYLAVAPELYFRQGDVSKLTDFGQIFSEVVSKVPDAQVLSDLDATVAWAEQNGGDSTRLGITGFCWGGRQTWLYAAHNPQVKAGVAWYGRLVGETSPLQPKHPREIAPTLTVPILGLYGGADTGIPAEVVAQMQSALQAGHTSSEIILYPDAPHAFHSDYRPSYRPEAAQDGEGRMFAWFAEHGVV